MEPLDPTAVCAVVVTYHPDLNLATRLARVASQVGGVVVVDNGSGEEACARLRALAQGAIEVLFNGANLGVARALNLGIARARARGFAWVLLLDQDSEVEADLVRELLAAYAGCALRERVAVVGARFIDTRTGRDDAPRRRTRAGGASGELWEEVESVITSGSLLPLTCHAMLGPFREELFIDHVDSDYCHRARSRGLLVIKTRRTLMRHAIGAATGHRLLGRTRWTSNHSADRRYYFARNDTLMLREHGGYRAGGWALKSLARRLRECKRIVLYEQGKTRKLAAVLGGWWDGMRGRLGPR